MTPNTTPVPTTRLGAAGPVTSVIGLGCMGMSGMYGAADDEQSIETIRGALDLGVTLLDTGDFYGMGHNEMLLGRALAGRPREEFLVSVKYGALRGPDGSWLGIDNRPVATANFLTHSLTRLGLDHVDVYRPARLDPNVPIEETVGAIAELVEKGYVGHIGLSEVGSETIRRAAAVHPIADLQIEYSLLSRGIEADILATCRELGIAITAYGVLSRGLIGGGAQTYGADDFRAHSPRFQGENLDRNLTLVQRLEPIAARHGLSVAQLAFAWVAAQGEDVVPLVGTRNLARVQEALTAATTELSAGELHEIAQAVPASEVAGSRYAEAQLAMLDSER